MKKIKLTTLSLSLALALAGTNTVMAGAFQLFEQSAAGLGTGQATAGAGCNDAATEYTNPAGMVCFKRPTVTQGLEVISFDTKFTGTTKTQNINGTGLNIAKTGTANGGTTNGVPNMHFVLPITDKLYYGGGLSVPFGLSTRYDENSVVAQYATNSFIQTQNFSQDLAYAFNSHFSVGAGIDFQQFEGDFDTEELGLSLLNDTNHASSNAIGWHAGVLYRMTPTTRFGVAYHSKITQKATGNGTLQGTTLPVSTDFILPAWLTIGAYHDINKRWAIMSTFNYTYWSAVKSLSLKGIQIALNGQQTLTVPLNFNNSYEISVGTTYKFTHKWTGKFGLSYDETPVNNAHRELRLPDANKISVAIGAHYQATEHLSLDVGYEHAFMKDVKVNTTIPIGNTVMSWNLNGTSSNSADIVGIQATYKF